MGLQDRDYMRRPADEGGRYASADDRAEAFLDRFLQRHPRFPLYLGIGLGALILIGLAVALIPRGRH